MEICFIYTLKLGTVGNLSMSAHGPRLQFVIGVHDSPKTEAKGSSCLRARDMKSLALHDFL